MKLILSFFILLVLSAGQMLYTVNRKVSNNAINTNQTNTNIQTNKNTLTSDFSQIVGGWESTASGGSYYVFNKDNTFYWYKSSSDLNDNYYKGEMKVVKGADAMSELGLSYEGLITNILNSNGNISLDNIYALTLKPTYLISGGVDKTSTLTSSSEMKLLFVYVNNSTAQAYNYNTGDTYYLVKK